MVQELHIHFPDCQDEDRHYFLLCTTDERSFPSASSMHSSGAEKGEVVECTRIALYRFQLGSKLPAFDKVTELAW